MNKIKGWLKELLFGWIPDWQDRRQIEKRLERLGRKDA